MKCALSAVALLALAVPARADVVAPPPADAPSTAAPATPADPLAEPRDLVESGANTIANLKKAITLYETALADASLPLKARVDGWVDVSRAYMRWGDLVTAEKEKIALYEKGQAAAKKAEALDPNSAPAVFWATANLACIGRTRGVMNSLFMLGDLRKGNNRALALDENYHFARNTLGEIDHAVPGFAGGSDERAEKAYLEVLRRDPHFTATMVLLAKLKRDQGEKEEARKWAQKVLDEKAPTLKNDWRKFDVPDAKAVLASLQ